MQQTEKYQFDLIESSDPFSPQPLNDNMAKVETALKAADAAVTAHRTEVNAALANHRTEVNAALADHRAEVNAALSAQSATVAALPRIVSGTYTGTGEYGADHPIVLEVPDAERPPSVILVSDSANDNQAIMIRGMTRCIVFSYMYEQHFINLTWTDKGVRWCDEKNSGAQLNYTNEVYSYAIFI